jgi:hypothetical protein
MGREVVEVLRMSSSEGLLWTQLDLRIHKRPEVFWPTVGLEASYDGL